ncbi:hypothetical protein SAMN04487970_1002171 [Paenibacillus tianmuensis]|uniref:Uncharacterized protein n=1 Tax=Paenibacillus tianmuensis TaxID=624147 RepID=A0A1G4PH19_9BACL|nr:hypothetical protein YDYSG_17650 [Paenibacillus tyrfis]GMX61549.1 hypothetical protein Elgi_13530 [Paenibacillus elgii]SCW31428.1 hypothetical protein SAMN04487970_1002171 [Paenibacillus tianmuensis]
MEPTTDLEKLRMRLWDRYLTLQDRNKISFDQYWYEFLIRYSITDEDLNGETAAK